MSVNNVEVTSSATACQVVRWEGSDLAEKLAGWQCEFLAGRLQSWSRHPGWLLVFQQGLSHRVFCLEAVDEAGQTTGLLPLSLLSSPMFGRFLVGPPYLNTGGVIAENQEVASPLIDEAVTMADALDVRYLELRHEREIEHPRLGDKLTSKVHMRLNLPPTPGELWDAFKPKVRNQIRKGEGQEFSMHWGRGDLLSDFYTVFSRNMRDLGTPVFGKGLFACIVSQFPERAEFCVVRDGQRPIAAALLIHGDTVTEVPSASSLRSYNSSNVNMWMYWNLLSRSIERGQEVFDFGRSSRDSSTFRFKRQWGAEPHPAVWQYYVRRGSVSDMRPDNSQYDRMIRIWRRLPVWLTRLIGPTIVRGIP